MRVSMAATSGWPSRFFAGPEREQSKHRAKVMMDPVAQGANTGSMPAAGKREPALLAWTDQVSGEGGEAWAARQCHGQVELLAQQFQNERDPGFTPNGQPPQDRSPDQDGTRATGERFEHVGPPSDPPVHVNFDRAGH